jgi:hypothetical protein
MKCPLCEREMRPTPCAERDDHFDYRCKCGAMYCSFEQLFWDTPNAEPKKLNFQKNET